VHGAGTSLRLPAVVGHDVVPGVVFVPANSTPTPARSLLGPSGEGTVTVQAVEPAEVDG
jgi:hypothetical protein